MIQVRDRCCKNLLCANNSQFSHVYVSPSTFQVNDNNIIPTGKCSRGRSYLQNLNLLKLMISSWIQKYQSRAKVCFLGFFFGPCYLPWGQSEDLSSPTATTFPLQSFPTWGKPHVPRGWGIWGQSALSVILSSLWAGPHTLPGYHQFLSNSTWPHEKILEDPTYIFSHDYPPWCSVQTEKHPEGNVPRLWWCWFLDGGAVYGFSSIFLYFPKDL